MQVSVVISDFVRALVRPHPVFMSIWSRFRSALVPISAEFPPTYNIALLFNLLLYELCISLTHTLVLYSICSSSFINVNAVLWFIAFSFVVKESSVPQDLSSRHVQFPIRLDRVTK